MTIVKVKRACDGSVIVLKLSNVGNKKVSLTMMTLLGEAETVRSKKKKKEIHFQKGCNSQH